MIFSHSLCCKVCPRRYPKRLISLLATSDKSSEVTIVLGHGQIVHRHSLLLFGVQLSSLPLLVVLGYSLILRLDIGPDPFPMQFEHMGSIGPHNSPSKSCFSASREKMRILIPSSDLPYDLVSLGQIATTRVCFLVTHP